LPPQGDNLLKGSTVLFPNLSSDYILLNGEYENIACKVFCLSRGTILKDDLLNNTIAISGLSIGVNVIEKK
jgi:hypothetical protein